MAKKAGCKGATKGRKQAKLVADFGAVVIRKIGALDNRVLGKEKIRNWCSQVTKQNRLLVQEKGTES